MNSFKVSKCDLIQLNPIDVTTHFEHEVVNQGPILKRFLHLRTKLQMRPKACSNGMQQIFVNIDFELWFH